MLLQLKRVYGKLCMAEVKEKGYPIMTQTVENFLKYVKIDTQSDEKSGTSPSTLKQHDLAGLLYQELLDMGAKEVFYDEEHCYVYASVPATEGCENAPVLGFISHMDTSPDVSGKSVDPRIVENYDGGDILLNREQNIVMRVADFPELSKHLGEDLIVTDGTTLLGADDKAGVAEIMAMAKYFLEHPNESHGKIRIGFTPDEEIGCGVDYFDVERFGADFAYTVDGGALGELEYENFNAASAKLIVNGRNVHPGYAKGKMKNAILMANEFLSCFAQDETPMTTDGYQGFYHVNGIRGNVEQVVVDFIIRDHDRQKFEEKKKYFKQVAADCAVRYGNKDSFIVEIEDSYYNMREVLEQHMHLVENAKACMEEMGITPIVVPIRGGTDGARLSFMGLPCPNICTGGENYHSRYEFASVQSMNRITDLLCRIAEKYVDF